MVKIFPNADRGFAHQVMAATRGKGDHVERENDELLEKMIEAGASGGDSSLGGDAEAASSLSAAFAET